MRGGENSDVENVIAAFNCPNCGAAVSPDSLACAYCRSAIAVRICPSCYGPVAIGMKHCPSCGAETVGPPAGSAGALECPRCESGLSRLTVAGCSLHECLNCGGLWLDKKTFQDICSRQEDRETVLGFPSASEAPPSSPQDKPQRTYIPCPECKKLMNIKSFSGCSGVVMDWCREHGFWLDRGELQKIIFFLRSGGRRKVREREMEDLKDQQARLRMLRIESLQEKPFDSSLRISLDSNECAGDRLTRFLSRIFSL